MRNLNFYDISDFEFNIRIAMVVGATNLYDLLFQILSLYYISMKQCNIFKKNSAYTLKMNIETILRKKPLPSNLKKKIVFI